MSDEGIWSRKFIQEAWIKFLSGSRASSALQALFDALQCTPRVSFINFKRSFSKGSESFKEQKTPQISLQYTIIGEIKQSNSLFINLAGLFKLTVF